MQKITTFLMFNNQAEEAVNLYVSIFKDSEIVSISHYGEGGPMPAGRAMGIEFRLAGQPFSAFNGGPHFSFSEGISLFVSCETQDEVDELWEKLSEGGEPGQCGWLTDRFGVSWQIIPTVLGQLLQDSNPRKAQNVMDAMLQMSKIDIAGLEHAYAKA
jgi:predicted 3-demethylubiquinone-9 3-methyltransferase (glyoxalase superfamily)